MKRQNIISYLITLIATIIVLFLVLSIFDKFYQIDLGQAIFMFLIGAIISGLLSTIVHELGHYFAGRRKGFVFSSMAIWFFKWTKYNKKTKFNFVFMGEEAGYTEMIPTNPDSVDNDFVSMTRGGIIASFILMLTGIPPLFMPFLSSWIFSIWTMLLIVGIYYFLGSILPVSNYGVLNDGAVLFDFKKQTDTSKVMINLLKIQAYLYAGKLPSEISEDLYFNLPQLPEDNLNFALLLNARYSYYLDKKDYENADKTSKRLLSLEDYLPKTYLTIFKTDALYNACTFAYDETLADDLMYEVEKYINKINSATNVRIKLSYLLNVRGEKDNLDVFFKKAYKEARKHQIKGLGEFERKLLDELNEKNIKS